jgi:hypothetical protein
MKLLKPNTAMYTLHEGNVVKCHVLNYITDRKYLVLLPKGAAKIIQRDRLFTTIDACIDDRMACIMQEAAGLEMQRTRKGAAR